jgi:hypothetical protein
MLQSLVSLSTTNAKYIVMIEVAMEKLWVKRLIKELGI